MQSPIKARGLAWQAAMQEVSSPLHIIGAVSAVWLTRNNPATAAMAAMILCVMFVSPR
jgi:hypothetical protein